MEDAGTQSKPMLKGGVGNSPANTSCFVVSPVDRQEESQDPRLSFVFWFCKRLTYEDHEVMFASRCVLAELLVFGSLDLVSIRHAEVSQDQYLQISPVF